MVSRVPPLRICVGAHHQPDCHHWDYLKQGVEAFLASDEVRNAVRAFGLPIRVGMTGDSTVEQMIAFLDEGKRRWYESRGEW